MQWIEKNIREIKDNVVSLISDEWMLVTCGNRDKYNMMTASWGSIGEMWGKDCAVTVVRPQRYTFEFIDQLDYFTLSFYGDEGKKLIHKVCGSQSGRDINKTSEAGLTPVFDDDFIYFKQARLVLCCKKLYAQDIDPACFADKSLVEKWYDGDFHRAYVGEIVKTLVKTE